MNEALAHALTQTGQESTGQINVQALEDQAESSTLSD